MELRSDKRAPGTFIWSQKGHPVSGTWRRTLAELHLIKDGKTSPHSLSLSGLSTSSSPPKKISVTVLIKNRSIFSRVLSVALIHLSSRPFPAMATSVGAANAAVFKDPKIQTQIQTFKAFKPWTALPVTTSRSRPRSSPSVIRAVSTVRIFISIWIFRLVGENFFLDEGMSLGFWNRECWRFFCLVAEKT